MRALAALALGLLAAMPAPAAAARCAQSAADRVAIRAAIERYRDRWLAGDRAGVMATFTTRPTLMPPGGSRPLVGWAEIDRFWWPAGPKTTITRLDITFEEIGGDCRVGFARGVDSVAWTTEGAGGEHGNSGTYLNVMQKGADGVWRISHHMWDDDPAKRR